MSKHLMWATGGAFSFWLPVIAVFAVQRVHTNVLVTNIAALLGFSVCWATRRWAYPQGRQGVWMLVGLYFFGPTLLSAATTFANGGFAQIDGWTEIRWLLLASVFPPIQFLLAATSGLWPSLVIVTVILIWASMTERRDGVEV